MLGELHDNVLAAEIGIFARGDINAARVMSYQIAYTAGGGAAFGNAAVKALNDDTAGLGEIVRLGNDNEIIELTYEQCAWFATAIVEYAALLAEHKVMLSPADGTMSFDDEISVLAFDFTDETWTFNEVQPETWHPGFAAVISAAHDMVGLDPEVRYFFEESIGAVSFLLGKEAMDGPWTPPVLPPVIGGEGEEEIAVPQAMLVVGTEFDDEFLTSDDEFALAHYLAGDGNDRITGNGAGVVFGGDGNDEISNVEWAIGGADDDVFSNIVYASGGSGDDTFTECVVAWGGAGSDEFYYETSSNYELVITIVYDPYLTEEDFVNSDIWAALDAGGAYGMYYIVNPDVSDVLYIDGIPFLGTDVGIMLTGTHEYFTESPQVPQGYWTEGFVELYGMFDAGLGWHAYAQDGALNLHNVNFAIDDFGLQRSYGNVFWDQGTTIIRGLQDGDFGISVPDSMNPALIWYDEDDDHMGDSSDTDEYAVDDLSETGPLNVDFASYSLLGL